MKDNPFILAVDDDDLGEIDKEQSYALTHWDEVLSANNMTQEDYDRQCAEIIQMQREDLELKRQEDEERAHRWTWYGF